MSRAFQNLAGWLETAFPEIYGHWGHIMAGLGINLKIKRIDSFLENSAVTSGAVFVKR